MCADLVDEFNAATGSDGACRDHLLHRLLHGRRTDQARIKRSCRTGRVTCHRPSTRG
ncbi:hypothetical protein [Williamsia sp. Leaf354]|uniref:hypothetical protein n=1 Tax=Williamsia sp. Leaf354 TaxID=1736349 RepID=UPI001F2DA498|nr:hypothetical protein [Williamsia sp. Leaf354]